MVKRECCWEEEVVNTQVTRRGRITGLGKWSGRKVKVIVLGEDGIEVPGPNGERVVISKERAKVIGRIIMASLKKMGDPRLR